MVRHGNVTLKKVTTMKSVSHGPANLALPSVGSLKAVGRGLEIAHSLVDGLL